LRWNSKFYSGSKNRQTLNDYTSLTGLGSATERALHLGTFTND